MSQSPQYGVPPVPPPHTQVIVQTPQQPTNGLGLAGFITSLVGLVSCGFLSPVGLLLSLIGLLKRPRGFAIAGTVLGLLGSAFLAFVGFTLVLGLFGLGKAVETLGKEFETISAGQKAARVITDERTRTGSLPSDEAGTALIKSHVDAWGNPMRYKRSGMDFSIISNGADGEPGTDDDRSYTENELRQPTTRPSGVDLDDDVDLEASDEPTAEDAKTP